ncbi:transcriptional regulator domain-containing protein [Paremcibacter congregatus]|nr:DUF6499 domain-containing protein [Paremcibacter congregatus]
MTDNNKKDKTTDKYDGIESQNSSAWAWEFLKRNPEYRKLKPVTKDDPE